jgi:hypothetical protein
MTDSYFLGAYWGPRQDSLQSCANCLATVLTELSKIQPSLFSKWFAQGASREEALNSEITIDGAQLLSVLTKGVNRKDIDRSPMPRLGNRVSLWTGHGDDQSASLSLICGSTTPMPGPSNNLLLDFPSDTSAFTGLLEPVTLNKIMASAVLAFDPDWAVITSIDHLNKVRAARSNGPFAGWISYFKQLGRQEAESLPSIRRELLSSDPVILTLAQDGFTSSISSHADAADRVTQNLRQHNII